ncbi:MAG: TlpA disulfide reductase family protein [Gammaproteobacteria bacterium]
MRPQYLVLIALALLAGSAGYVAQHWLQRDGARDNGNLVDAAEVAAQPRPAEPERPLDWSFSSPDGQRQALANWAGKLVVLNFWATWCPPCLREIPAFIELQQELGDDGVQFIGIALDQAGPVEKFVAEKGVNYPVLIGDQDVARFMVTLGNDIGALPYTVVLDKTGEVVLRHQGEWEAAAAGTALRALVEAR